MSSVNYAPRSMDSSVAALVSDYFARGGQVTRLPVTDARLRPSRHRLDWSSLGARADAGTVYRAARTTRVRAPVAHENWPPMDAVVETVGPCTSQPGSRRHERYAILQPGLTLGELRSKGLRLSDLTRYLGSGAVSIAIPTSQAEAAE